MKTTLHAALTFIPVFAGLGFAQGSKPVPSGNQFKPAEQAAAAAYWTAFRLENATPMPLPRLDSVVAQFAQPAPPSGSTASARVLAGTRPRNATTPGKDSSDVPGIQSLKMANHGDAAVDPATSTAGYVYPFNNHQVPDVNSYPYSAVGKLFFVIPPGASSAPGEYVCSGAVFYDSHTVLTARHCIYDYATGTWYQNFVFYPGYNGGPNPSLNSGWTTRFAWTWTGGAATMDFDIGFLQLNDAAGFGCNGSSGTPPIQYYTGSLGVWIFSDPSQYASIQEDVLAYPQAAPFSGDYMYQDSAVVGAVNPLGTSSIVEIGNPQSGGADGGPWITGLNPNGASNGTNNTLSLSNIITGLNSFKWTNPDQPLATNGPAFLNYNVWDLYTGYQGAPCP